MRLTLAAAAIASALVLSGCGHDPLVHGPFLIGAQPADQYPPGCRPGAVISQDAKSGWDRCMLADGQVAHQAAIVLAPLPPPPAATSAVRPAYAASAARSAW